VLGPTALQSGSYNKPGYLRLDYSWSSALSTETKSEIEEVSNLAIRGDLAVSAQFMSVPEAKAWGAVALFGETYDESVRVIQIGGPWSRELCGGTHVARSSQIGLVSLIGEASVGSGSRRLEALVGIEAFRSLAAERALVSRLVELTKSPREQLEERLGATVDELRAAQRKLAALQSGALAERIPAIFNAAITVGNVKLAAANLGEVDSVEDLRQVASGLRDRFGETAGVAAAVAQVAGKPMVVIAATKAAQSQGAKAGALVRIVSSILGGGGGGKDDIAQGGGTDVSKIAEAMQALEKALV
jgi:alanyl-tRNA synthetase